MLQHLVLVALGGHSPRMTEELTGAILDCSCSISDSRISHQGGYYSALVKISGTWDAIAKLENQLPGRMDSLGLTYRLERLQEPATTPGMMPYAIDAVCVDRPGVIHEIVRFMADNELQVQDLYSNTYQAANTGTQMFSVHMTINIPSDTAVSLVRNDFMDFCDRLNLDAIMEPVK